MNRSLKFKNSFFLTAFVFAQSTAVWWIISGLPFSWETIKNSGAAEWLKTGGVLVILALLIVRFLNRLGSSHFKAILIFWHWKDPLPGSRAFSQLIHRDPRIDVTKLRRHMGGVFPTIPAQENSAWYGFYRNHAEIPSVQDGHSDYLLFRDMVWLTILVAPMGAILFFSILRDPKTVLYYMIAEVILYLAIRFVGVQAGERFVMTVLACEGAKSTSKPTIITGVTT